MNRVVQDGSGTTRPLVLVYHLAPSNDAALIAAVTSNAAVVNDTRTNHYVDVPPLATTVAQLEAQLGARLSPIVLAGFSEGGLVTKSLLDRGAAPDALVIADGTYGSDYASWTKFANLAKQRRRAMLASYSAGTDKPWIGLKAITGFPLAYGSALPQPMKYSDGSLVVLGYGDGDHGKQGTTVLPLMLTAALSATSPSPAPTPKPVVTSPAKSNAALVALLITGAAGALAWGIYQLRSGRRVFMRRSA